MLSIRHESNWFRQPPPSPVSLLNVCSEPVSNPVLSWAVVCLSFGWEQRGFFTGWKKLACAPSDSNRRQVSRLPVRTLECSCWGRKSRKRTELSWSVNLLYCKRRQTIQGQLDWNKSWRQGALALLNLSPCSSPWQCSCHRLYRASGGRTPASDTLPWWTRPCWDFRETGTKWRWLQRCSRNKED